MRRTAALFLAAASCLLAEKKPFDINALLALQRLSDPQISPDTQWVTFTIQNVDVSANTRPKHIYIVPMAGGTPRQLTQAGQNNERARWSPDSRRIAFISDRGGSSQVWTMDPDGSNTRQITKLATEAGGVTFSGDGKTLLFTSEVFPECKDEACNSDRLEAEKQNKVKARIYTGLLYRHWNQWQGARRSHLFSVAIDGDAPVDLTPGEREAPPFSLGGPDDYALSPDGGEVCFTRFSGPIPATGTNMDLYVVPLGGGDQRKITSNPGADSGPSYSPDGKYLAYRSQARAGYESDRWRLTVLERATGKLTYLADNLDRPVTGFTWAPDSTRLFFTVEDRGRQPVYYASVAGGGLRMVLSGDAHFDEIQLARDGKTMVYTANTGSQPAEIYKVSSAGGTPTPLARLNESVLNGYQLTKMEDFTVEGAERGQVHSFMVKPPEFSPDRKHPVLMLIHGGPQGAWGQAWSYRWNPQIFAAAGYVVVMPNPRGSTGYGQKFTDEINMDWGGRAYDDIVAVSDYVAAQPWADSNRMAAAGGSYGGYMVNWILGHTNRFRALVSHAGVYDLQSMFGETEELWFPLWEFGGTPWDNPEQYSRWSPSQFVKEFNTPTLVIHGELDYRVPVGQGLQLYTALQMQNVPSKLLLFPDEGHWILKPQNSILWHRTFIDWIHHWTAKK
jgi:dipeptidyl aminopeptidase/acylaminoacyl peptidase